jgi:dipeptidyl aminopeptidase/acylaminoacyl peptidase
MPRPLTIDDLAAIAVPEQPALSPDGTRVVYVLRRADLDADRDVRSLWEVALDGGAPRPLTDGPADSAPAFSPDGSRLAFLRASDGPAQIWLAPAGGGEPAPLTALALGAGAPAWSPDGSAIAFTATVDVAAVEGEDDAARERRAHAPIVADRLDYFADGVGMRRTRRTHVHVVDVAGGACRRVTDGDWDAGAPAWSPDGTRLAFPAAMDPDRDLTRARGTYVLDLSEPGAQPRRVGGTEGWSGPVNWSADGDALLSVGTEGPPTGHYSLLAIALADGATRDLSAPLDRNVMFGTPGYPGAVPRPAGDGTNVLFCATDHGDTHLYSVPEDGGRPTTLVGGVRRCVNGLSVAAGRVAFVLSTADSFGEIATIDLAGGAETVHSDHGTSLAGITSYPREEREFTISDGTVVQGWLMRDPAFEGPRPLLLDMHGGPHNSWNGRVDDVHLYHQELVARGWAVLVLNPRASDGYGVRFYTAALGGWGVEDAKDFLEPLDALVAEGVADPGRLALTGYSYGGYMTCFLTSRDDRFAAAVAGGLISDLTSVSGTADNRRGLSDGQFGGRPWADRARYDEQSPMARVEHVRTPTLVLHGEADVRSPFGQAQQWHTALRELGVPTRLVIYPGSSHQFTLNGRPSHRLDYNRRVRDWVLRYAS